MQVNIEASWKKVLEAEFEKEYFKQLVKFVKDEYSKYKIFPEGKNIFRAFLMCPWESVKVVIIGQDPYHGFNQANGLSFSVNDNVNFPPSLRNIFKEIQNELNIEFPKSGNLDRWAEQGVLLLNATLTVRANLAGSHQKKGWEEFSDAVIKQISDHKENIVFLLWGRFAQEKGKMIDTTKHLILQSAHPSPFSADKGFFGNGHFKKTNEYLKSIGKEVIVW